MFIFKLLSSIFEIFIFFVFIICIISITVASKLLIFTRIEKKDPRKHKTCFKKESVKLATFEEENTITNEQVLYPKEQEQNICST